MANKLYSISYMSYDGSDCDYETIATSKQHAENNFIDDCIDGYVYDISVAWEVEKVDGKWQRKRQ